MKRCSVGCVWGGGGVAGREGKGEEGGGRDLRQRQHFFSRDTLTHNYHTQTTAVAGGDHQSEKKKNTPGCHDLLSTNTPRAHSTHTSYHGCTPSLGGREWTCHKWRWMDARTQINRGHEGCAPLQTLRHRLLAILNTQANELAG